MSNYLNTILGSMAQPGVQRLRGGAASIQIQGAQVGLDPKYQDQINDMRQFGDKMQLLGNTLETWGKNREKEGKKTGEDRANYLMQHFTPEQLAKARADGTMQYHDDPYAMKALNIKIGQTVAQDIDSSLMTRIQNNEFHDRVSLDKARVQAMNDTARQKVEAYGGNFDDIDLQAGMNSQVVERNMLMYGAHDKWMDAKVKGQIALQSKMDSNVLYSHEDVLRSKDGGTIIWGNLENQRQFGGWTPEQSRAQVVAHLTEIANKPGGEQALQNMWGKKFNYDGQMVTPESFLTEDQKQSLDLKAAQFRMNTDAEYKEQFLTKMTAIENNENLGEAQGQLALMKDEYNKTHESKIPTPERDRMIQLEQALIVKQRQQNDAQKTALTKQAQAMNRQDVIEAQWNRRLGGEQVPTDYQNMPSNEATGSFSYADEVSFANAKLRQIDNSTMTQAQKDATKLKYLRNDSEKGAFRQNMQTLVDTADQQWQAAIVNGKMPEDTSAIDNLRRIREMDKGTFAMLYPKQATLFAQMDMMSSQGVDPQVLIDSTRQQQTQSKEMRFQADKDWADLHNQSDFKDISRIPTEMDNAARQIYDATLFRTGNKDMAGQQVSQYLKDSTVTFKDSDVEGSSIGMVPKASLMVTDDPASYTQGQQVIEAAMQGITDANPWVTRKQLDVSAQGNNIYITDTTGQIRIRYDRDTLRRVFADQQAKEQKAAQDKAIADANYRPSGNEGIFKNKLNTRK